MKQPSYVAYTFAQILNEMPPVNLRRLILPTVTLALGVAVIWMVMAL